MAKTIQFSVIDAFQFHGSQKIICTVKAKDLCPFIRDWNVDSWSLPLNANVRKPTKNKVLEGIVEAIANGLKEISNPITIAASSYKEFVISGDRPRVEIAFDSDSETGEWYGVLDGGHRLLACRIAEIRGIDISNLALQLCIYTGLTSQEVKDKAIELNTSQKVSSASLAHYKGDFDWIKEYLQDYQIQYYSGQRGVPDDVFCTASRVFSLVLLLNKNYSPFNLENQKRHPTFAANTGDVSSRKDFQDIVKRYKHLIRDIINLQTGIALTVDRLAQKKTIPWVTKPKDIKKNTHLPTGEILNCKLPSRVLTHPILSSFRLLLDEDLQWCCDINKVSGVLIPVLVKRYCELLKQQRFLGRPADSVATDPFVWDALCQTLIKEAQQMSITPDVPMKNANLDLQAS